MFTEHPELKVAYDTKEEMFEIYKAADRREGEQRYIRWRKNMPISMTRRFGGVLQKIKERSHDIDNYFDHPYTASYMEGLNRCIGDMHREGRGYKIDTLRGKLFVSHGYGFEEQPKFERVHIKPWTDYDYRDLHDALLALRDIRMSKLVYLGFDMAAAYIRTPGIFRSGNHKERKYKSMPW